MTRYCCCKNQRLCTCTLWISLQCAEDDKGAATIDVNHPGPVELVQLTLMRPSTSPSTATSVSASADTAGEKLMPRWAAGIVHVEAAFCSRLYTHIHPITVRTGAWLGEFRCMMPDTQREEHQQANPITMKARPIVVQIWEGQGERAICMDAEVPACMMVVALTWQQWPVPGQRLQGQWRWPQPHSVQRRSEVPLSRKQMLHWQPLLWAGDGKHMKLGCRRNGVEMKLMG